MQSKPDAENSSIRILHIITGLAVGGAEMALCKLLSSMNRDRFENAVLSLMPDDVLTPKIKKEGTPVYSLEMRGVVPSIKTVCRLKQIVKDFQPHIVQGWMCHGNLAAWLACVLCEKRPALAWNIRNALHEMSSEKRMTRWIIRSGALLSRFPEKIIYNSETALKQHQTIGYSNKKAVVIPNGFDVEKFCPNENARDYLRKALGIDNDAVLIGLIGRFHPCKRHEDFIEAAQVFKDTHTHFIMAGRNVDNSNELLTHKIHTLGLEKQFHLMGEYENIAQLQAALDIATSVSYSEAFSNVIGEAMACGTPCVVTDVGDSAKIVGDTGIVISPRNPARLAEAWKKLLDMPSKERKAFGQKARQRVMDFYTLDKITWRYEKLYEVLANPVR